MNMKIIFHNNSLITALSPFSCLFLIFNWWYIRAIMPHRKKTLGIMCKIYLEQWSVWWGGCKCLLWGTFSSIRQCQKQPLCSIVFGWFQGSSTMVYDFFDGCPPSVKLCDGHIFSFWTKALFTRIIDTSPMRTTKTPPTLSMLSSFASVFLFVSCNRRIRSGLHQMTQLLNKKRTNFANTLLSPDEDDDDGHNESMMWTYIALAATSSLFPPSVFQHMKSPRLLGKATNFKRWNFPEQKKQRVIKRETIVKRDENQGWFQPIYLPI